MNRGRSNSRSSDPHPERKRQCVFTTELHRLRMQAGISQEALAFEADVSVSMVARLERGDRFPSLDMATRLADVLGNHLLRKVSLDEFRTQIIGETA